ncbi:cell division protein ZapA [Alkalihalophilus lindianensis]|uniref:Cell division protein ZapA n=1 Tax=Alkalihalophilus lindianensis TaxID=1630542 RepID=A0ABU3XAB5_9BACI|nr:cell division protein ZapA [Alkalihalophilus lindianensis]MDV2684825.1 cell division protein ZapA [Alkalihalophilus lindianensis]
MSKKNQKQRTTVSIYGQNYTVVGQESPAHIKEVAQEVDQKMREIKKRNPYLDTTRLAVLTAVNIVDEYKKLQLKLEQGVTSNVESNRTTGDE